MVSEDIRSVSEDESENTSRHAKESSKFPTDIFKKLMAEALD